MVALAYKKNKRPFFDHLTLSNLSKAINQVVKVVANGCKYPNTPYLYP